MNASTTLKEGHLRVQSCPRLPRSFLSLKRQLSVPDPPEISFDDGKEGISNAPRILADQGCGAESRRAREEERAHTLYTLTDATINVSLHLLVLLSYYSVHI